MEFRSRVRCASTGDMTQWQNEFKWNLDNSLPTTPRKLAEHVVNLESLHNPAQTQSHNMPPNDNNWIQMMANMHELFQYFREVQQKTDRRKQTFNVECDLDTSITDLNYNASGSSHYEEYHSALQMFYASMFVHYSKLSSNSVQRLDYLTLDRLSSMLPPIFYPKCICPSEMCPEKSVLNEDVFAFGICDGSLLLWHSTSVVLLHRVASIDHESYSDSHYLHRLGNADQWIEGSQRQCPKPVAKVLQHPTSPTQLLALFSNSSLSSLQTGNQLDSNVLYIGSYNLSSFVDTSDHSIHPAHVISMHLVLYEGHVYRGPSGPVLAFAVDPAGRIYLLTHWNPRPSNLTIERTCSLLCLEVLPQSTLGLPIVKWCHSIRDLSTDHSPNCIQVCPQTDEISLYWPDRTIPSRIWVMHIDPNQMNASTTGNEAKWSGEERVVIHIPFPVSRRQRMLHMNCWMRDTEHDIGIFHELTDGSVRLIIIRISQRQASGTRSIYPLYAFNLSSPTNFKTPPSWLTTEPNQHTVLCADRTGSVFLFPMNRKSLSIIPSVTATQPVFAGQILQTDKFVSEMLTELSFSLLCRIQYRFPDSSQYSMPKLASDEPRVPVNFFHVQTRDQCNHLYRMSEKVSLTRELRHLFRTVATTMERWCMQTPPSASRIHMKMSTPDSGCLSMDSLLSSPVMHLTDTRDDSLTHASINEEILLKGIPRLTVNHLARIGEFGTGKHQFLEPNGIAVLPGSVIAVADGNAEMIKFFSSDGRFLNSWHISTARSTNAYPNCIAVRQRTVKDKKIDGSNSDQWSPSHRWLVGPEEEGLVVVLRKPCPAIQVYTFNGLKLREFAYDLASPKCVAVDSEGHIVVVESHVMRVNVYTWSGALLHRFQASLQFPTSVALDRDKRIYIADNLRHCVIVHTYTGQPIGCIGSPGLTNFPIGVAVWPGETSDHILIVDNHNRVNVTIFRPNGYLVYAMQSLAKHAQSYAITLDIQNSTTTFKSTTFQDGGSHQMSILIASRDFRVYRYPLPAFGTPTPLVVLLALGFCNNLASRAGYTQWFRVLAWTLTPLMCSCPWTHLLHQHQVT